MLPSKRKRAATSSAITAEALATTMSGMARLGMSALTLRGSLVFSERRAPGRRRNDRQAPASHAQQHGRTIGVTTGRKPADVVGGAGVTLQHGVQSLSTRRYVAQTRSDAST